MKTQNKKILITIGTHGDEKVGFDVLKSLQKNKKDDLFDYIIANPKAVKAKKRYVDSDLNRVFPGKKNGNHEEKLAYKLVQKIKKYDLVIDIHSTESLLRDALIITKLNKGIKKLVSIVNPKNLLYMKFSSKSALISSAKLGIAFEYGKDNNKDATARIVKDIEKVLDYYSGDNNKIKKHGKTKAYEISEILMKKEGETLNKNIKNYKLVKKGDTIVEHKNYKVISEINFYPILFGNHNYENMFGFLGERIDI